MKMSTTRLIMSMQTFREGVLEGILGKENACAHRMKTEIKFNKKGLDANERIFIL
jgi:hypothetical protein